MARLVECVPNFSEGRNRAVIDAIADAIKGVADVKLLDVDPGADTNRTVYTFVGPPEAVADAALKAAQQGLRTDRHGEAPGRAPAHGRHGRLPDRPDLGCDDGRVRRDLARHRPADRGGAGPAGLPLRVRGHVRGRRSLANIRAGEYEGLERKLQDPAWAPDAGPARFDPKFGAPVVGAREFLIAYNVNLNTRDRKLANEIALNIREGGRLKRDKAGNPVVDEHGKQVKVPGRLKAVRAIGWYIEQYRQAQVSINLINYKTTPLHVVFETVREEAEKLGLIVTGSELVGLMPLQPLIDAGTFYLRKQGKSAGAPEREVVETADPLARPRPVGRVRRRTRR